MNDSQLKIKDFMDQRVNQLRSGLANLNDRDKQPDPLGDLYNGILRHSIEFEITHMKQLERDLIEVLK